MKRLSLVSSSVLALSCALAACSGSGVTPSTGSQLAMSDGAQAAPKIGNIVYTGPECKAGTKGCPKAHPEIDLFSTQPRTDGYSGSFKLAQAGWTKPFTYKFGSVTGHPNNCPGTSTAAYSLTPASGKAGRTYTARASKSKAGECLVTFTGGDKKTVKVVLTYTTSSVGVH